MRGKGVNREWRFGWSGVLRCRDSSSRGLLRMTAGVRGMGGGGFTAMGRMSQWREGGDHKVRPYGGRCRDCV